MQTGTSISQTPLPISVVTMRLLKQYIFRSDLTNQNKLLTGYPDLNMVNYLLSGFKQGFLIGYEGLDFLLITHNLPSATDNPEQVAAAIIKELERGHTAGPFIHPPFENFQCSPLGAVPKKDGTHCLIIDLSSPDGLSINNFISKEDYSLMFSKFDDVVNSLGRSAVMVKLDIKHAFRLCPVSPVDWHLLAHTGRASTSFN